MSAGTDAGGRAADTGASPLASRAGAWLSATASRRSRRRFDGAPLDADILDRVERVCESFRPYPDARVELVPEPGPGIFHGIVGSYGKVTGAPHVLLVIADESSPTCQSHAGYTGEAVILEAASHGLDTCWIGGFFRPRRVRRLVSLGPDERVVAISPLGRATVGVTGSEATLRRLAGSHARDPLEVIAPGSAAWPAWARAAAETVRTAPSAMNRQPWRLRLEGDGLVVARDARREAPRVTRALDCGIAMLHAELGARGAGVSGKWTDLADGLDVARFEPEA